MTTIEAQQIAANLLLSGALCVAIAVVLDAPEVDESREDYHE